MVAYWRWHDITVNADFGPIGASVQINNSQPCDVATASFQLEDDDTVQDEHEIECMFSPTGDPDDEEPLFRGFCSVHELGHFLAETPARFGVDARDYTTLLDDTILIDSNRKKSESVTDRVLWIMGKTPTHGVGTAGVATISDEIDPFNYNGMSKNEALNQVASQVGAVFYVDFEKELQFYLATATIAAPFGLKFPAATGFVSYRDFSMKKDATDRADEVFVKGEGVHVWRPDGAPTGGKQRAIVDSQITKLRMAKKIGDIELERIGTAHKAGSLLMFEPGLSSGQTVNIVNPVHSIDDDFVISKVTLTPLEDAENGTLVQCQVDFADQLLCKPEIDLTKDQPADDSGDGTDGTDDGGGTGPGSGDCNDCERVIVPLDDAMTDAVVLAFGANGCYPFDGSTMQKFNKCLDEVWTAGISGDVANFGHEPGSSTPILLAPLGIGKADGHTEWDRSAEVTPTAARPMDSPHDWVVGDAVTGGGGITQPFGGYGTFDLNFGPGANQELVWRCFAQANPGGPYPLRITWAAGEIYKGVAAGGAPNSAFARFKWDTSASWNDPDVPPDNSDIAGRTGHAMTTTGGEYSGDPMETGGIYASTYGETVDWVPLAAGGGAWPAANFPLGQWIVIWAESKQLGGAGAYGPAGAHLTFTMDDNGTSDALDLLCASGEVVPGTSGPVLQKRKARTGALVSEIELDDTTDQIRTTPNSQSVSLLYGAGDFQRYGRDLDLEDEISVAGFTTSLQDWNLDDDFNLYRLASAVLYKYNRAGRLLWDVDLDAEVGWEYPSGASMQGNVLFVDEHVWVAGIINNKAALLTIGRRLGRIVSNQRLKSDGNARAFAVGRFGPCVVVAGRQDGTELDGESLSSPRWLMRIRTQEAD